MNEWVKINYEQCFLFLQLPKGELYITNYSENIYYCHKRGLKLLYLKTYKRKEKKKKIKIIS